MKVPRTYIPRGRGYSDLHRQRLPINRTCTPDVHVTADLHRFYIRCTGQRSYEVYVFPYAFSPLTIRSPVFQRIMYLCPPSCAKISLQYPSCRVSISASLTVHPFNCIRYIAHASAGGASIFVCMFIAR